MICHPAHRSPAAVFAAREASCGWLAQSPVGGRGARGRVVVGRDETGWLGANRKQGFYYLCIYQCYFFEYKTAPAAPLARTAHQQSSQARKRSTILLRILPPPSFFAFFHALSVAHLPHTHTHTHDTVPPPNPTPAATKMFSLPSPPSSPKPPASQRRTAYSHTRVIPTLQRHETQLCDRRRGGANTLSFEELAAREELWASEASQESDGWRSDASYSSAASAK